MLHRSYRRFLMLVAAVLVAVMAAAQVGSACPGFRNPTTFNTNDTDYFWSARVGDRTYTSGNYNDTTTGYHIMSTCTTHPDIKGHANITSTSYNSGSDNLTSGCGHNFFDANDKRFQIITATNAGIDQFTVAPGTTGGMPRIPPGYQTSIRLGDMNSTGQAVSLSGGGSGSGGNNKGAEALFYTMEVTSLNSLLFINYAVVARRYSHSAYDAGEFLIRVVAQNDNGTWPNAPINDSLWYKVSAPTFTGSEMPAGWLVGAGNVNNWPCTYAYKPWSKVAISLSRYLYRKVRIEMYTSDCIYNADPIYAYISGDFQSMTINVSGCVDFTSDVVDTLRAPEGLLSYQWFVTTQGAENNLYNADYMETVSFRPISEVVDSNVYMPTVSDFVLTAGPNAGDTVGTQTFLCVMTSALDPLKPMTSKVYANVTNNQPMVRFLAETDCDLNVQLTDQSFCYGDIEICPDSCRWIIYADTTDQTPIDTLWGANASYHFPTDGDYLVSLRDMLYGRPCGGMASKVVHAHAVHVPQIVVDEHALCDGERATVSCGSFCNLTKQWQIGDSIVDDVNTFSWIPPVGTTPITLTVSDHGECEGVATDSVKVYGHTEVTSGASVPFICPGDSVVLNADGLDQPHWTSTPHDPSLDSVQGQNVVVVYPVVTTTYRVEPSQNVRCMQNSSDIVIEVLDIPTPIIDASSSYVDMADPTIDFNDRSVNGGHGQWTFSDGGKASGAHVEHTFRTAGVDSVSVTLHTCNRELCCADTSMTLPVKPTAVWFPNAFTPETESNNTFGVITAAKLHSYEIFIYNRQGSLVHHSTDPDQPWDGVGDDGTDCPQGAYVYYYRYTLATNPRRPLEGHGTVTLIR